MARTLTRHLMATRWAGRTSAVVTWRPRAVALVVIILLVLALGAATCGGGRLTFMVRSGAAEDMKSARPVRHEGGER